MGLSTINPLFLDSTKPIGDKSITNIELTQIFLRNDEALYLEVTNQMDIPQRFSMTPIVTKKSVKYHTTILLKHQQQVKGRFIIESSTELLYVSKVYEIFSGNHLSEKWEPCFVSSESIIKGEKKSPRKSQTTKERKQTREIKVNLSKSLCEPYFVEQIKNLLEDL